MKSRNKEVEIWKLNICKIAKVEIDKLKIGNLQINNFILLCWKSRAVAEHAARVTAARLLDRNTAAGLARRLEKARSLLRGA